MGIWRYAKNNPFKDIAYNTLDIAVHTLNSPQTQQPSVAGSSISFHRLTIQLYIGSLELYYQGIS